MFRRLAQCLRTLRPQSRKRLQVVCIVGTLWLNLLFFLDNVRGANRGTDFAVFYTAGLILRAGMGPQLYSNPLQFRLQEAFLGHLPFRQGPLPYIHPPFEAPIFVPLTYFSYAIAWWLWNAINLAILGAVILLLRRYVSVLNKIAFWKLILTLLAFFPIFACLLEGQDSILLLLFCSLAFCAMKRDSDVLAGCWLALGSFKFQFMIPILLFFLLWRRSRLLLGFVPVGVLLLGLSLLLVGTKTLLGYPWYAVHVVNQTRLGGVPLSLLPNLQGLVRGWPKPFSGVLGIVLALSTSALLFAFGAWEGRSAKTWNNLELQFSLAVCIAVLIAWQTNIHDLSLLILPIILIVEHLCREHEQESAVAVSLLLPVTPLLIGPLWIALWLVIGQVNLIVIPMLWWIWEIAQHITRNSPNKPSVAIECCEAR